MTPSEITGLRYKLMLTVQEFARVMNVTDIAVRHWETGKREPQGPALRLMQVLAKYPRLVQEYL